MNKVLKIILLLIIAIGWMVCIFKLSGMNSKNSNGKSTDIISLFIEDALDITNDYGITNSHPSDEKLAHASELINAPARKVIHASVYFILAFFSMLLWDVILDHKHYFIALLLSFIICVIFAISDELHQTFVAGRTGQPLDVLIDSAGALVGLVFYSTYHIVFKSGYKKAKKEMEEN
ncbi:MAG TPA: VanZ family protein [Clostridiaceae bacterium]|nr:VanZ family protein [Clostridiaceae bacterium]